MTAAVLQFQTVTDRHPCRLLFTQQIHCMLASPLSVRIVFMVRMISAFIAILYYIDTITPS